MHSFVAKLGRRLKDERREGNETSERMWRERKVSNWY
jgi:hypothetical protein